MSTQLHKDIFGSSRRNRENSSDNEKIAPSPGITYEDVRQDPGYADSWKPKSIKKYKEAVYDRISALVISKFSEIEPYIEGNGILSLQKTYKDGRLVTGKEDSDMLVVYEHDVEANRDDADFESTLLKWLKWTDVDQISLTIERVVSSSDGDNPLGLNSPPNLVLNTPAGGSLNINHMMGKLNLDKVGIKDNVSQFLEIKKTKTSINRSKLKEYVDTEFSELAPVTFTQLLEQYNKFKNDIPFYRYRTEDFFVEYGRATDVPNEYRLEKFFEEFDKIKDNMPKGSFSYATVTILAKGIAWPLRGSSRLKVKTSKGNDKYVYSEKWDNITNKHSTRSSNGHRMTVFSPDSLENGEWNGKIKFDNTYSTYEYNTTRLFARGAGMNNHQSNRLKFKNDVYKKPDTEVRPHTRRRGHNMTVFNQSNFINGKWNGKVKHSKYYDTYSPHSRHAGWCRNTKHTFDGYDGEKSNGCRTALARDILDKDIIADGDLVTITSFDAIGYTDYLVDAMNSIGASDPKLVGGSTWKNCDLGFFLAGQWCDGWPTVKIWINGRVVLHRGINHSHWVWYDFRLRHYGVPMRRDGKLKIIVRFENDRYQPGRCDRNLWFRYLRRGRRGGHHLQTVGGSDHFRVYDTHSTMIKNSQGNIPGSYVRYTGFNGNEYSYQTRHWRGDSGVMAWGGDVRIDTHVTDIFKPHQYTWDPNPGWDVRTPYALVGYGGAGKGNGWQAQTNDGRTTPPADVDVSLIQAGNKWHKIRHPRRKNKSWCNDVTHPINGSLESDGCRTAFARDILDPNIISDGDLIVITTKGRVGYTDYLIDAMKTIGAHNPVIDIDMNSKTAAMYIRYPYSLIGWRGAAMGGGIESVTDGDIPATSEKIWPENPKFMGWKYKTAAYLVTELQDLFADKDIPFFSPDDIKALTDKVEELKTENKVLLTEMRNHAMEAEILQEGNTDAALDSISQTPQAKKGGLVSQIGKGGRTQPKPVNKMRGK